MHNFLKEFTLWRKSCIFSVFFIITTPDSPHDAARKCFILYVCGCGIVVLMKKSRNSFITQSPQFSHFWQSDVKQFTFFWRFSESLRKRCFLDNSVWRNWLNSSVTVLHGSLSQQTSSSALDVLQHLSYLHQGGKTMSRRGILHRDALGLLATSSTHTIINGIIFVCESSKLYSVHVYVNVGYNL